MTLFADFNPNVSVPFSRLRQLFEDSGLQAGVVGANDFKVTQRGAGANMSVDVSAGQAWVEITTGTRNGLAHVVNDATANVAVTASHATLPRIDQIVLQYNDTSIPTGSGDVPTVAVLAGTATSGATLDNRTGAATLGNDRLRLADILVPAASTSVTTANIRDRRSWARGAYWFQTGDNAGNHTTTSGTFDVTPFAQYQTRLDCTGAPIELEFSGRAWNTTAAASVVIAMFDTVAGANEIVGSRLTVVSPAASESDVFQHVHRFTPTAGPHVFTPAMLTVGVGTATIANSGNDFTHWRVEEKIRQVTHA